MRGTYCGLFIDTNTATALSPGGFTFTTSPSGSLSGVWQMGAERFRLSGRFDDNGTFTKTLWHPGSTPVTVTLLLDMTNSTPLVTGSVGDGRWRAALTGYRAVFDGTRTIAPQAGRYTLLLPGNSASNAPSGDGYGALTISKRGAVRLTGTLADGTRFTQAATLSPDGQWPLYAPLYGRQGWLWSWLIFTNPPTGDLGGDLSWVKPPLERAQYYREGFALTLAARGAAYQPVRAGTRLLNSTNVSVVLSGGALSYDLSVSGGLSPRNRVTLGDHWQLSVSANTGTFRGKALNPATRKRISFGGVMLQRQNLGCGSFLGEGDSGRVRFGAANETGYAAAFQTLDQTFSAQTEIDAALLETFFWTWADGSNSSEYPGTFKDFGTALPRYQYLSVYPPDGLRAINLGFDHTDGGEETPLSPQPPQNIGAVLFPAPLPNLRCWASAYTPITNTLDFTGCSSLEYIECYSCTNLQHVRLAKLPSLRRACVELCALRELDISGDPNLEDVRAAQNRYTSITTGGGTGPKIWHWCTRDNPQLTQRLAAVQDNLFSLMVCNMWNDNQSGALSFVSTNLMYVDVHHNQYSSIDLSGHDGLLRCVLYDNHLTNLVLTSCPQLQVFDVHQNRLPPAVLDRLLELLDTTAPRLVQADLSQNAGPPSSAGYQHYLNLLNRGVNVRADF